ncbi:hypothetical protein [Candidatus Neptunochlamydia vexilliferae]|uniref:hypothetical protein n=1 Tax=Candidatus Neptunichlamydia vexilliferae TaxID=1651774 RepID=UPI001E51C66A|nr:hypothetical protein [Candidatus Neptunochlamydia vexilliferae]
MLENAYKYAKGELDFFKVEALKEIVKKLKNIDPSSKESLGTFAQATLLLKTYASFLGRTIPLAGLLVPLSQLYLKSGNVTKSFEAWMKTNHWNENYEALIDLVKASTSCLIPMIELMAYGALFVIPGMFIFPITASLAMITLYECYQEECKENPEFQKQLLSIF